MYLCVYACVCITQWQKDVTFGCSSFQGSRLVYVPMLCVSVCACVYVQMCVLFDCVLVLGDG